MSQEKETKSEFKIILKTAEQRDQFMKLAEAWNLNWELKRLEEEKK